MLIPTVLERSSNGDRAFDLYSMLLRNRIIFITGEIEPNMAQIVCAQLLYLDSENSKAPVNLYVQSNGGSINAGLAIVDTMNFVSTSVQTTVLGMAASMGSYIASQGEPGHRYVLPNAEILIHQPLGNTGHSQATDIVNAASHIIKLKRLLTEGYTLRACGKKSYEDFERVMERDFILSANEAVEWGLADSVITKKEILV